MRNAILSLLLMTTLYAGATPADSSSSILIPVRHRPYERNTVTATASLGFSDYYRNNFSVPSGFSKGTTTGFLPFFAKLEYGLTRHVSLAGTFGYDAFTNNFSQIYDGGGEPISRYMSNNTRIFSGGLTAYYHLLDVIHVKRLDPFVGLGVSLNNIRYSNYSQGDSTAVRLDHTVSPYIKAGARYYISSAFSLFADAGYDHHVAASLGVSCRFLKKRYYSDMDKDGVPDYADSCPHERGLVVLHGCPDADGDGVPDKDDKCPTVAGSAKYQGCPPPPPDSDGDGVPDDKDECPHDKGLAKFNGCPDRDGDGVPDNKDECPDVYGQIELHGCPAKEKPVDAAPVVVALPELKEIPPQLIRFNTGSSTIQRSSYDYLNTIAGLLKSHQPVKIVIDGYTDNTGRASLNRRLSVSRANVVRKYLIDHGADPAYISVVGHGSKAPVASNKTRKGRAKNRRVTVKVK
jgi:OmpA-OmpF porin, OOP family